MKDLDAILIGVVAGIWGGFGLAYWLLGMRTSAMTWAGGACVFLVFTVAMFLARPRAAAVTPTVEPGQGTQRRDDTALLATVCGVWTAFALVYAWMGMFTSAVTWGAGAWLFLLLTVGLVAARRRNRK